MPYLVKLSLFNKDAIEKEWDGKFDHKASIPFVFGNALTEADIAALPKRILIGKPQTKDRRPPGVFGWSNGFFFICESLKNKIEELEPNTHDFFPIEVVGKRNHEYYGVFYMIFTRQKIHAINEEQTVFSSKETGLEAARKTKYTFLIQFDSNKYPVTLRNSLISGKHFWRGTDDTRVGNFFCSDELHDFVKKEGIRGWRFFKCRLSS